jgi:CyaY protein
MLSEQVFRVKADEALDGAARALERLSDAGGFEVDVENGVLNVVFDRPRQTRFVVSPHAPMRQIWVSARAESYKLSWSEESRAFVLGGETLADLLDRLTRLSLREQASPGAGSSRTG